MRGVGIGEQQVQLALPQLGSHGGALLGHLLTELGVVFRQLIELDEVARATFELLPRSEQLSIQGRLARQLSRLVRVVPRARSR